MQEIVKMGEYIQLHNRSVIIFPEGTRSKTGLPKLFKRKGLLILLENAPNAWVLPISISNSWKLQRHGMFPIPVGTHIEIKVHPAIKVAGNDYNTLVDTIEKTIISEINSA